MAFAPRGSWSWTISMREDAAKASLSPLGTKSRLEIGSNSRREGQLKRIREWNAAWVLEISHAWEVWGRAERIHAAGSIAAEELTKEGTEEEFEGSGEMDWKTRKSSEEDGRRGLLDEGFLRRVAVVENADAVLALITERHQSEEVS